MFEIIRYISYTLILYNLFYVENIWVTVGFALLFFIAETLFWAMHLIKKAVFNPESEFSGFEQLGEPVEFSTKDVSNTEWDLIKEIKQGDEEAAEEFLHLRCSDKEMDFQGMPKQVKFGIASNLIKVIETDEESDVHWDEVIVEKEDKDN